MVFDLVFNSNEKYVDKLIQLLRAKYDELWTHQHNTELSAGKEDQVRYRTIQESDYEYVIERLNSQELVNKTLYQE